MPKLSLSERIAKMQQDRTVEREPPRFDVERTRRIATKMIHPDNMHRRHEVITFTRKVMRARDLNHFYTFATEADVRNVERILGI